MKETTQERYPEIDICKEYMAWDGGVTLVVTCQRWEVTKYEYYVTVTKYVFQYFVLY